MYTYCLNAHVHMYFSIQYVRLHIKVNIKKTIGEVKDNSKTIYRVYVGASISCCSSQKAQAILCVYITISTPDLVFPTNFARVVRVQSSPEKRK